MAALSNARCSGDSETRSTHDTSDAKSDGTAGSDAPSSCVPNQSITCTGPGGCAGGQACKADGSGYGACDCGTTQDASNDSMSACVPNQSIACVGPGGCAGSQICKSDGSGYSLCDCGTPLDAGADSGPDGDSAAGALAPDQIPGLSLWLDSMKGIVADVAHSGSITVWADQSSWGNNAKTPAYQEEPMLLPLDYKSFDVIRFPSGHILRIDDSVSLQFGTGDFAIVFVMKKPISDLVNLWNKNESNGLLVQAGVNIDALTASAEAHAYFSNPNLFHIVSIRGAALEIRLDGVGTKGTTNTTDVSAPAWWTLIGAGASIQNSGTVDYLEIAAYKGAVSDSQIAGLEAFLQNKYKF